ncbi:MAG: hypothetical protein CR971_01785 [candidate division SR1 bacterium]|nr:MAG: hypothetical protein CR971_01785 [candidate division SR1 bacterium]
MYTGFWITEKKGNNSFCFDEEKNQQRIYIAPRIKGDLSDLALGSKPVFREKNQQGVIVEYQGLEKFVELSLPSKGRRLAKRDGGVGKGKRTCPCIIFDNHNHALFFWYEAYTNNLFKKGVKVIHIDQHTDMNENTHILDDIDTLTEQKIFDFTNCSCNVGNFIKPALQSRLIGSVELITTEYKLLHFDTADEKLEQEEYILDIDLDFWHPDMSIEQFDTTIQQTRKLIQHAKYITIATSPYFLDQQLAIDIIEKIFII